MKSSPRRKKSSWDYSGKTTYLNQSPCKPNISVSGFCVATRARTVVAGVPSL
ncbi:MAG: hypothetical protein LUQ47_05595 [Methanotrichaceae archaeon]|nr:hypothetical protein [Methanotrichaceae archaeon]